MIRRLVRRTLTILLLLVLVFGILRTKTVVSVSSDRPVVNQPDTPDPDGRHRILVDPSQGLGR